MSTKPPSVQTLYKKYLIQISKKIHPDLFAFDPQAQSLNSTCLQSLNGLVTSFDPSSDSSSVIRIPLKMYIKTQRSNTVCIEHDLENLKRPQLRPTPTQLLQSFFGLCQKLDIPISDSDKSLIRSNQFPQPLNHPQQPTRGHKPKFEFAKEFRNFVGVESLKSKTRHIPLKMDPKRLYFDNDLTVSQKAQAWKTLRSIALDEGWRKDWKTLPLRVSKEYKTDMLGFFVVPWKCTRKDLDEYLSPSLVAQKKTEYLNFKSQKNS